jgi:glutaredoxin
VRTMSTATIFTKPGCPYCAAAKYDLQRRKIQHVEHNVQADRAALDRMLDVNVGKRMVPTIVEDGQVQVGFHGY